MRIGDVMSIKNMATFAVSLDDVGGSVLVGITKTTRRKRAITPLRIERRG
jgi:hypothetical protein